MEDVEAVEEQNTPRRSSRLALTEINESSGFSTDGTPNKSTSPDEMIIIQRGPRKKPLTWSPLEYSRSKILAPPRETTPEPVIHRQRCEINSRLRRRLIMSPGKYPSQDLGMVIAKKLRALNNPEKI